MLQVYKTASKVVNVQRETVILVVHSKFVFFFSLGTKTVERIVSHRDFPLIFT